MNVLLIRHQGYSMGWTRLPGNITLGRDDIVYRPAGRNEHGTGPQYRHRLGETGFSTPRHAPDGSVAFRKKLTRGKVLGFLASQPRCLVAMEACGSRTIGAARSASSAMR